MRVLYPLAVALVAFAGAACLQYNDPCSGLVENPERPAGYIDGDVYLDRNNARHANNAIARLVGEAFVDAFPTGDRGVELALVNGGAIRSEGGVLGPDGQCLVRNTLQKGKVTYGDVHQILLFENLVYAISVQESVLFEALEHSVSGLVPTGGLIASPSGRFFHVAGAPGTEVRVDCLQPAGARVTGVTAGSRALSRTGDQTVRVALTNFILGGGDGYAMLKPLEADVATVLSEKEGGVDNAITAAFMAARYGSEATPLPVYDRDEAAQCADATKIDCAGEECCQSPIKLVNCAVPAPPPD